MERKCTICGDTILIDENNSVKAIRYKDKFYHYECFNNICDKRIASPRKDISITWTQIKEDIVGLVAETTKWKKFQVAKEELSEWLLSKYDLSFIGTRVYMKLNDIYNGTFKGLAYPIGPVELLEEWQYYWGELCAIRRNKGIIGESAINYDLTILLSRNVEYRKIKERERVAKEMRRQQTEEVVVPQIKTKWQPKNKVADLYKEMNGGDNNE